MDDLFFDFEDGNGPVKAIRWGNGGGWVAFTAEVDSSVYISGNARVYGYARVYGNVQVYGNAQVYGDALVSDNARVCGNARVYGDAQVYGDALISVDARVSGNARVSGDARVSGNAKVFKTPIHISGLQYSITITETHLFAGCQGHKFEEWREFSAEKIAEMDGEQATKFYPELLKIIELFCS